ncbi:MAG: 2,3-bisphosphoglycerate-independent phosphoglycerate mutase [Nitrospirota bacterium]|nr:2,3-bisphosphoglycerate-independent phosphoglycerate mutase [Nitrospirota bacterium]
MKVTMTVDALQTFHQSVRDHFAPRPTHLLIVLDGFGLGTKPEWDAIRSARAPHLDRLFATSPWTRLATHGPYVGLPAPKDLGGSEVGHLTMGAGQILDQGPTRINAAIADGSFFRSDALVELIRHCTGDAHALHLLGLLSDGNIHSHISHFEALIRHAHESGVQRLYVHALLDGRDVGVQSALDYTEQLEELLTWVNRHSQRDYCIASGGGREAITMDRDHNQERMKLGWDAHVHGRATRTFPSISAAVETLRAEHKGIVDQDLAPFVIVRDGKPVATIRDGDAVINVNFRGDRAIQISQAFTEANFTGFDRDGAPEILYAGMMVYDEDTNLPARQLMGPTKVANPFGRRILEAGMRQFRLAETQKFAHVTFFFNGGYRLPLDASREDYQLIPSDKGIPFDQAPQMKAPEIAARACELIRAGRHRFGLINFANTDMVGHTGNFRAAVAATEAVDAALGRIMAALTEVGGTALITADHGNADEMLVTNKKGEAEISTKHSLNLVPAILFDPTPLPGIALRRPLGGDNFSTTPGLSHVAATNFLMLGQAVPEELQPPLILPAGAAGTQ